MQAQVVRASREGELQENAEGKLLQHRKLCTTLSICLMCLLLQQEPT